MRFRALGLLFLMLNTSAVFAQSEIENKVIDDFLFQESQPQVYKRNLVSALNQIVTNEPNGDISQTQFQVSSAPLFYLADSSASFEQVVAKVESLGTPFIKLSKVSEDAFENEKEFKKLGIVETVEDLLSNFDYEIFNVIQKGQNLKTFDISYPVDVDPDQLKDILSAIKSHLKSKWGMSDSQIVSRPHELATIETVDGKAVAEDMPPGKAYYKYYPVSMSVPLKEVVPEETDVDLENDPNDVDNDVDPDTDIDANIDEFSAEDNNTDDKGDTEDNTDTEDADDTEDVDGATSVTISHDTNEYTSTSSGVGTVSDSGNDNGSRSSSSGSGPSGSSSSGGGSSVGSTGGSGKGQKRNKIHIKTARKKVKVKKYRMGRKNKVVCWFEQKFNVKTGLY